MRIRKEPLSYGPERLETQSLAPFNFYPENQKPYLAKEEVSFF
ncbi:hypothetical protein CCP2SC5_20077 [Azospirillaceae bacterium]